MTVKNFGKGTHTVSAKQILQIYARSCSFWQKTEWKDGKQVETEEDNIINSVEPLWTKTPSTLKDEDYKSSTTNSILCRMNLCSGYILM